MSVTVSYFFNSAESLPEVAEIVGDVLGCRFRPYEGNPADFFCRFLSLETSLFAHDFDDDRDLQFSAYRYALDTRTPVPDGDLRGVQLGFMASLPLLLQRRAGIREGMLVYNVQSLLARYETRGEQLFDICSARSVTIPEHLRHVFDRIQNA